MFHVSHSDVSLRLVEKFALRGRCVFENRYNKRSVVRLVILIFAGGPWAHGWHGPTKTHPWCRANVPALWFELLTKLFHFDQFCCINPPGDLGHSRRRQVQLSNVPTQITNSHSVCVSNFWIEVKLINNFIVLGGGSWALRWHGPMKTHPSCYENVPAFFFFEMPSSQAKNRQEPPTGVSFRFVGRSLQECRIQSQFVAPTILVCFFLVCVCVFVRGVLSEQMENFYSFRRCLRFNLLVSNEFYAGECGMIVRPH